MSISFIHTADIHLGRIFSKLPKEIARMRRQEIKNTLVNILEYAKEQSTDFIFISGDLFEEESITMSELKEISELFDRIKPIQLCIISGNHDPILNEMSIYNRITWSDNVHIFNEQQPFKIFEERKTIIYGLSWHKKILHEDLTKAIQPLNKAYYNLLLAHGDIYDLNSNYMPINKQNLLQKGFDYVALGHIHKFDQLADSIYYCGSPEPLNFGEDHPHGFIFGQLTEEEKIIRFIETGKRKYVTKEICINHHYFEKEIIQEIGNQINQTDLFRIILKCQYDQEHALDLNYIRDVINQQHFFVEIVDQTEIDWDVEGILKEHKNDMIGAFIQELNERKLDEEIYKKALSYGLEALLKEKGISS